MKILVLFLMLFVVSSVQAVNFVIPEVQNKFDAIDASISGIETLADGKILMGNGSNVATEVTPSGDVTMTNAGVNAIASGVIVNADVNASAAIAFSKLAPLVSGYLLVGNGSSVATGVAVTGDVAISNAGVTSISSGAIVNADVNASAAIAHSKLAEMTSGYILVGNGSSVATAVAMSGDTTISNAGAVTIGAGKVLESMLQDPTADALHVRRVARATYDFAVDGGTVGTIGSGVTLPDNAIITSCWYDVITTAQTAGADAGTMAINIPTDGDLQAAVAVSDGTNPYDAGLVECDTKGTDPGDPSTFLKTTAAREISWVIAGQNFTAGKFQLFLEYVVSD